MSIACGLQRADWSTCICALGSDIQYSIEWQRYDGILPYEALQQTLLDRLLQVAVRRDSLPIELSQNEENVATRMLDFTTTSTRFHSYTRNESTLIEGRGNKLY